MRLDDMERLGNRGSRGNLHNFLRTGQPPDEPPGWECAECAARAKARKKKRVLKGIGIGAAAIALAWAIYCDVISLKRIDQGVRWIIEGRTAVETRIADLSDQVSAGQHQAGRRAADHPAGGAGDSESARGDSASAGTTQPQ